ncbi:MAG: hypothetical protein ACJ73J_01655, partial [Actinomycetes bacterium]
GRREANHPAHERAAGRAPTEEGWCTPDAAAKEPEPASMRRVEAEIEPGSVPVPPLHRTWGCVDLKST